MLVQWKDDSTTWELLKDMKESYPIQVAEFSIKSRVCKEPAFALWVTFVMKKNQRIVSKVKSKYWTRTHKHGMKIPKSVKEAYEFDKDNKNTF